MTLMKMLRNMIVLLVVLMHLLLVVGCKEQEPTVKKPIKIAYNDEESFYNQYGDYFDAVFPNLDIKIIPTKSIYDYSGFGMLKEYERIMDQEQPDLVILWPLWFKEMVNHDKFYDITTFVEKDLDADQLYPIALEWLKSAGQGKLYGLNSHFTTYALYYNKSLFDEYGVDYPTDGMSWQEILRLAERFSNKHNGNKQVYGYHQMYLESPKDLITTIAGTQHLSFTNADGTRMTVDTKPWRDIFQMVVESLSRGNFTLQTVDTASPNAANKMDLFPKGNVAMTIDDLYYMNRLKQNNVPFDWGVVTTPIDPANPEFDNNYNPSSIFAIPANASHIETAWEVIRYFNGPDYAKLGHAQRYVGELPTRRDGKLNINKEVVDLIQRKSSADAQYSVYESLVPGLSELIDREIGKLLHEGGSVDEAVKRIQAEGQQLLDAVKTKKRYR